MESYHVETTINPGGILMIRNLPFHSGDVVEVVIRSTKKSNNRKNNRYPLHGKPIQYEKPFESVAEDEWEVLR